MLRVAVVGYGYWGSKHLRVLSTIRGVQAAIIEHDPARAAAAGQQFPAATRFSSLDAALPAVDAVVIATPPLSHAALARQALESGVHVMVEKPLAVDAESARELVALAERRQIVLMVGHTFEYNAAIWKLRELIESGHLGDVYYVDTERLNLGLYQSDVNVIWDLGPHDVSISNYLLNDVPDSVSAWGDAHSGSHKVDVASLRLNYGAARASAHARVSWLHPQKVRRVTVTGSRRMAVFDDLSPEPIKVFDRHVRHALVEPDALSTEYHDGDIVMPRFPSREPLLVEDEHFVACVRGDEACRTPGASGLAVVRVLEAADRALTLGSEVRVDTVGRSSQLESTALA